MIKIHFDSAAVNELYEAQLNHPNPRLRRKLQAIYLKSLNLDHRTICQICRISWPTLLVYFKEYRDGGIERVTQNLHRGHPSELNLYTRKIQSALTHCPPASLKEAKAKIKEITGLDRSLPQIWSFLHQLNLRPRKVGGVPGKVNLKEQESFKKKSSNRGLQKPNYGRGRSIS